MRCKSCNTPLSNFEMTRKLVIDGVVVYDDWCSVCRSKWGAQILIDSLDTHSYDHEHLTDVCFSAPSIDN